jgi:hypothetical protein
MEENGLIKTSHFFQICLYPVLDFHLLVARFIHVCSNKPNKDHDTCKQNGQPKGLTKPIKHVAIHHLPSHHHSHHTWGKPHHFDYKQKK